MGLIKALATVAHCRIRGHDFHRLTDWAGQWAWSRGWWLYECRRCRKRVRWDLVSFDARDLGPEDTPDEEIRIGGRYV